MSWIETLQKIIPWAAGLNVAPKIALSVLLSAFNVLCLMLIWMPARKSAGRPAKPLSIAEASGQTPKIPPGYSWDAGAIAKSPTPEAGFRDNRYELARLKSILFDLIQLQASNAPFPSILRHYARHPDPHSWEAVLLDSAKLASIAGELKNSLAAFKGDLIFEDIGTYRSICLGLHDCVDLHRSLTSFSAPSAPDELIQLTGIADGYDGLLDRMMHAQEALAQYAARKSRRRPKARDWDYPCAIKILSALNHRWLPNARLEGAGTRWYEVPAEDGYRFALPFGTPEEAANSQKNHEVISLAAVPSDRSSTGHRPRLSREGSWLVLRVPAAVLGKLAESAEGGRWLLQSSRKTVYAGWDDKPNIVM
ncbi:MAG: hypothetical protein V7642_5148 [Burkholderiales bacterium]